MQSPSAESPPKIRAVRKGTWQALQSGEFDVVILGGGVSGAALMRAMRTKGLRTLLVDQGDFGGGTSQASGMLVWGGLLYLKSLDIRTVRTLSQARDELLVELPEDIALARFRYILRKSGGRPAWMVRAALEAYWWLGGRRRTRAKRESHFECAELLSEGRFGDSIAFDEAHLIGSDARLVLDWILESRSETRLALNHCQVVEGQYNQGWTLQVHDRISGEQAEVRTQVLVNATGVWADPVAKLLGIQTKYRHVLSKGVYLGLPRPKSLNEFLAFEMGSEGDTQTFTPWGPVALWGPTETPIASLEPGLRPLASDVEFLLEQANTNLRVQYEPEDVISLRCGVRPLAVEQAFSKEVYPLSISRKHMIDVDRNRAAMTLFGGKITSAPALAKEAAQVLEQGLLSNRPKRYFSKGNQGGRARTHATGVLSPRPISARKAPMDFAFPGIDSLFVQPSWSVAYESCTSLLDYVRRRTNIAQWTPRMGLGRNDEHRRSLLQIATTIHGVADATEAVHRLSELADEQDRCLQTPGPAGPVYSSVSAPIDSVR